MLHQHSWGTALSIHASYKARILPGYKYSILISISRSRCSPSVKLRCAACKLLLYLYAANEKEKKRLKRLKRLNRVRTAAFIAGHRLSICKRAVGDRLWNVVITLQDGGWSEFTWQAKEYGWMYEEAIELLEWSFRAVDSPLIGSAPHLRPRSVAADLDRMRSYANHKFGKAKKQYNSKKGQKKTRKSKEIQRPLRSSITGLWWSTADTKDTLKALRRWIRPWPLRPKYPAVTGAFRFRAEKLKQDEGAWWVFSNC